MVNIGVALTDLELLFCSTGNADGRSMCGKFFFQCHSDFRLCIPRRFTCDGVVVSCFFFCCSIVTLD